MHDPQQLPWSRRLLVLCVVAAVAVSVIYLPQPLLTDLARSLGTSEAAASVIATTVQAGYAVGIFFLVPLADRVQPRRQISIQLTVLALAMLLTAALPGVTAVAVGFLVVGLVANIAQLIIPTAGRLSPPEARARTTSALVGALVVGIFGGRVLASVLGGPLGWRWVAVVFAVLVLVLVPLVRRVLPSHVELVSDVGYGRLLAATVGRLRTSAALRQSALMQLFAFAAFNAVWTVMVLHLEAAPYRWSVAQAGLFGLVGLAAGLVTPLAGRLVPRLGAVPVVGLSLLVLALAMATLVVDSHVLWGFALSTFALTLASQSMQSANQGRVLEANADGGAQANTVFMVAVFAGGSLGAAAGSAAFGWGGMPAVAGLGLLFLAVSAVGWLTATRHDRRHGPSRSTTPSPV
ncbi:MFS transporter [Streptomyces sp. NP160]|nr:MFS transporter [Streptomyces sp. NP160]